jgi:hypothetical protein
VISLCLAAEAIGEAGLQLFVEIGMDVDNDLVRSLIHQVILEKIQTTMSQKDPENPSMIPVDDARQPAVPHAHSVTTQKQVAGTDVIQVCCFVFFFYFFIGTPIHGEQHIQKYIKTNKT